MEQLEIQISGSIQNSNFPFWKNSLLKQINEINLELVTDNDFAVATEDVKYLKKAEKAISESKVQAIQQTEEIQLLFTALDEVSEQARQARLTLDRQIRKRKQEIKDELIENSISEIRNYIELKPDIFTRLDNSKYLQRHQYELSIKGKSSIINAKNALKSLVQKFKAEIDEESQKIISNYKIIEAIPANNKLLFQDINHLVTLSEKELRLTIENRIVKLSEQKAIRKAESAEKELYEIDDEALLGIINEDKSQYVITVELLSPRQIAIETARSIKSLLDGSSYLVDMKLSKKRD